MLMTMKWISFRDHFLTPYLNKWCLKDMQKQWTQLKIKYTITDRIVPSSPIIPAILVPSSSISPTSEPSCHYSHLRNVFVFLSRLSSIKSNLISSPGRSSSFSQGAAAPPSSGIPGSSRLNTMSKHQLFGHPLCILDPCICITPSCKLNYLEIRFWKVHQIVFIF